MGVQVGDLLLFRVSRSSNWLDKAIGWGQRVIHQAPTDADYCHVAIVGPTPDRMYEAVWPKFHNTALAPELVQKNLILEFYRVRDSTPEQVKKVMDYCQTLVGDPYPVISILTFGLVTLGHAPYCSQAAWRAWMAADRLICADEQMVSPDDIAGSKAVIRVA